MGVVLQHEEIAMSDWNPTLYRQFEDERTRPARELLARVMVEAPAKVVDLGCGPGNSTELLAARYPGAELLGIDNSAAMLAEARQRVPGARFEEQNIESWAPAAPVDVVYANAALQWVPDHKILVPRLFNVVAPGGVLAFQMPDNADEPTHRLMRSTAMEPEFAGIIGDASAVRTKILPVTWYYDLLAGQAAAVEVWRTVYYHVMDSAEAIVTWLRATGLRPFIDPLPDDLRASFLKIYTAKIAAAYPAHAGGKLLLAFPRMFVVARRG